MEQEYLMKKAVAVKKDYVEYKAHVFVNGELANTYTIRTDKLTKAS